MVAQAAGGGTAYIPTGLPPGVDQESGEYLNQPLNNDGSNVSWFTTVPSGECWLVHFVWFTILTDATATVRTPEVHYTDSDGVLRAQVHSFPSIPASKSANATFTLGQATAGEVAQPPLAFSNGALPYVYLYGGYKLTLGLDASAAGDFIPNPGLPLNKSMTCFVTKWDVGSQSGPQDQQLGPFMFVPGPQTTTA